MKFTFLPQLNALEGRDVPAVLSFQLPDGTVGQGTFSTPAGVDSEQDIQRLALVDLTVTLGGVAYAVRSGATASYANGVLTGVTATATASGHDTISLSAVTARVGPDTAPIAYDGADTQAAFTLPDGTVAALSYVIPWDQVDPDQASQSLTPAAFNLNIAGQNFAYGSANYTTPPTLQFANGDLRGLTFAVNLAGTGSPYLSVSVANAIATVQDAATGQFITAPTANTGSASITLDFSTVTIPATGSVKYTLAVKTLDGKQKTATVEVFAGATQAQVRDLFEASLDGLGVVAKTSGATGLNIRGTADSGLKGIEASGFGGLAVSPKQVGRTPDATDRYPTYDR